ncbi:MAG TPA: c-type cytochrome [Steroidobacteraceae bacterium]|jgi:cytochrome c oxidase cbb3-type subunit 3
MCSRFPTKWPLWLALTLAAGCNNGSHVALPSNEPAEVGVIDSALDPGVGHSLVTTDARAAAYYNNAEAVNTGKRLFSQYNCSGCHSNGGGGMAPDLMDDVWIYGSRLEQIHQTLVDGRPNGMPAWGGKVPDQQLWALAAYVRSLSLPQTIAAETGNTPSQMPAPVPPEADQDAGWAPPPGTTNDYTSTIVGPSGPEVPADTVGPTNPRPVNAMGAN